MTSNGSIAENDGSGDEETSSVGSWSTNTETTSRSRSETPTFAVAKGRRGKKGRKRKSVNHVPTINQNAPYKYNCHFIEDHDHEIFGVQFLSNPVDDDLLVFAAVGSNRATVYECPRSGGMKVLTVYGDPAPTEIFYTCAWSYDSERSPLLAVAGLNGVVRVINVTTGVCVRNLTGHGAAVNELKFHPKDPTILLSASKDHELRLWNIKTKVCVAILGTVDGHRDEVLSADFSADGESIMSCGMDHSLKLWRLDKDEVREALAKSHKYHHHLAGKKFDTWSIHSPDFTTRDIHQNYVDCVKWFGELVLSKSCDNCIVCWKPGPLLDDKKIQGKWSLIHRFQLQDCEIWFMRFATFFNEQQKILTVGSKPGRIYMWTLDDNNPEASQCFELTHPKCTKPVRQMTFSRDGSVMIAVCDDATVWRWDRVGPASSDKSKSLS